MPRHQPGTDKSKTHPSKVKSKKQALIRLTQMGSPKLVGDLGGIADYLGDETRKEFARLGRKDSAAVAGWAVGGVGKRMEKDRSQCGAEGHGVCGDGRPAALIVDRAGGDWRSGGDTGSGKRTRRQAGWRATSCTRFGRRQTANCGWGRKVGWYEGSGKERGFDGRRFRRWMGSCDEGH